MRAAAGDGWQHLSTANGDLEPPTNSNQQVMTLVLDVDGDGTNDFVIGSRRNPGPSLVWYRRDAAGWTRHIIESSMLQMEAGGAYYDIDGDGDLDIVAGSNNQTNIIWWWENPHPNHSPQTNWTRREIKSGGAKKHHDMMFGDFNDDGAVELVYWNQAAKALMMVDIPSNPKTTQPWPNPVQIYGAADNKREGLDAADIDGDGQLDIVGGGYWFKHNNGNNFIPNLIEQITFGRVAAGQLIPGGRPEIVQVPGDANGPARWFEWDGSSWIGRDLPVGQIKQGHSLALGDVNNDGHLDIFIGEMRFAAGNNKHNPNARTIILYGDGQGGFAEEIVATGFGHHESRLADLDGDGDLDILGKPFTWDTPRLDIWLNGEGGSGPPPTATATPTAGACVPLSQWQTRVVDNNRPGMAVFVDAADLSGDGLPDIVAGGYWYRNPGTPGGTWQRSAVGTGFDQFAVLADFDNDGDIDLLGTTWDGQNPNQQHKGDEFVWASNDGAGNFTIHDNIQAGNGDFLQGALIESFSAGTREVILSWHNGTPVQSLAVPADAINSQWAMSDISSQSQGEDLSAGDIDRDGDLDLLLGAVWLQNNSGSWAAHTLFTTGDHPDRNRLVDMNGDGRLDAVVGYEAISDPGKLAWYEAPVNPEQPWTEHVIDTIIGPMSLDAADLDGDGDIDVVAGEHHKNQPSQGRVFVYRNDNDGADFERFLVATGDEHHDGTQLVDIDNDGDLDIISIGWTHGRVLLYEHISCNPGTQPTHTPEPPTHTPVPPTETPTGPTATPIPPTATATATETSTAPTATSTATATSTVQPPTATPTVTPSPTATSEPAPGGLVYYVSSTGKGSVGGVAFDDEDILRFDSSTELWELYFDGSDVGLGSNDVDAFHLREDGTILLSLDKAGTVPDVGKVDDSDILLFTPTSLGENTAGTFSLYFDGSNVGLTTNGENINSITETDGGELIVSTFGKATVPGLTVKKWDLMKFTPTALGAQTAGDWSLYLQGKDIGLTTNTEMIFGLSLIDANHVYISTKGAFALDNISGGKTDLFRCILVSPGSPSECNPAPDVVWLGGQYGFNKPIDGIMIVDESGDE